MLRYLLFFLLTALSVLPEKPAFSQTPRISVKDKPEWVVTSSGNVQNPPPETVTEGYFIELIEQQIHAEEQSSYTRIIQKIVTEAGVQNGSEILVNFIPAYEKLSFHEIIVWRDKQPLNRLDVSSFKILANENDLSRFIYNGSYSAYMILEDIRKGDRIEYSYTISGRNPIFQDYFFDDIYLQSSSTISHLYSSLLVSARRTLSFKSFNKVPEVKASEEGGLKRYEWEAFQVQGAEYEAYQPSWFDNYAHVQVSEYSGWQEVAGWAMEINPVEISSGGKLAEMVAELKASSANLSQYQDNAIKMVQNDIRYMGVEIGEYSHRANRPGKVLKQRYGDCKDKSLLLVSLLRSAGIEAYMALVNTGSGKKTEEFLPSPFAFNHAIVQVAGKGGGATWIDPTISYQGGSGRDIYFPSYGKALVLKEGTTSLTDIPYSDHGKVYCEESYFLPSEEDTVRLEVKTTYTSNQSDEMRSRLAYSGRAEMKKNYLEYYSKLYSDVISADSLHVTDDPETNKLVLREYYLINGFMQRDSSTNMGQVNFYANYINDQLPSIAANRKHPVAVNYPYSLDYKIRVISSDGWNIPKERFSIKRDAYYFHMYTASMEDTLTLHYQFAFLKEFVPAAGAAEFAADIKKLSDEKLSYGVTVRPGGLSEGPHWGAIVFSMLIAGLYIYLARRIYYRKTRQSPEDFTAQAGKLGGWMILPMIGLFISPFYILGGLYSEGYYTHQLWQQTLIVYPNTTGFFLGSIMVFEIAGNLFIGCYAVFCLVTMLKRRDIFPKLVIGFYAANLLIILLDYFFLYLSGIDFSINGAEIKDIVRVFIGAAIWIPYFSISSRVKETFIVPYPRIFVRAQALAAEEIYSEEGI